MSTKKEQKYLVRQSSLNRLAESVQVATEQPNATFTIDELADEINHLRGKKTCTELGFTVEDDDDDETNLEKLAQAINKGFDIIVDKKFKIYKPAEKTDSGSTHCYQKITNPYNIFITGQGPETGFSFIHKVGETEIGDNDIVYDQEGINDVTEANKTLYDFDNSWFTNQNIGVFAVQNNVKKIVIQNLTIDCGNAELYNKEFITYTTETAENGTPYYKLKTTNLLPLTLFYIENEDTPLINDFTLQNCQIEGPLRLIQYFGRDQKENDNEVPSYGINYLNVKNNIMRNLTLNTSFIHITCPNKETEISHNDITNFDGVFLYSGLNNEQRHLANYRGNANICYNTVKCEKDFFRIDLDPETYYKPTASEGKTDYYCFALVENTQVDYHNNTVEGLKMDIRSNNAELYDLYSGSIRINYHDNVWKNIFKARTQFYVDSINNTQSYFGRWQLIQAKSTVLGSNDFANGSRNYHHNSFIIEPNFLKEIEWNWIDNYGSLQVGLTDNLYDYFIKKYSPRLMLITSDQYQFDITYNKINMPSLYGGSDIKLSNLNIECNEIQLQYLINRFFTLNSPNNILPINFNFKQNKVKINSSFATFTVKNDHNTEETQTIQGNVIFNKYYKNKDNDHIIIDNNSFIITKQMNFMEGNKSITYTPDLNGFSVAYNKIQYYLDSTVPEASTDTFLTNIGPLTYNNIFSGHIPILYRNFATPQELQLNFDFINASTNNNVINNSLYLSNKYKAVGDIVDFPDGSSGQSINAQKCFNQGIVKFTTNETLSQTLISLEYEPYKVNFTKKEDLKKVACVIHESYTGDIVSVYQNWKDTEGYAVTLPILLLTGTFIDRYNKEKKLVIPEVSYWDNDTEQAETLILDTNNITLESAYSDSFSGSTQILQNNNFKINLHILNSYLSLVYMIKPEELTNNKLTHLSLEGSIIKTFPSKYYNPNAQTATNLNWENNENSQA